MENKETKEVKFEDILEVTTCVARVLNEVDINYLVTGSMAYRVVTGDELALVHDVDIIVSQADLEQIERIFSQPSSEFVPYKSEFSVHANHKFLKGLDDQPFDVSLDSYEHYYQSMGIQIEDHQIINIAGTPVKVMTSDQLKQVYTFVIENRGPEKREENQRKLSILKDLHET